MTEVPPPADRIEPIELEVEMQRSYLDYAMSVIVGRALPDVRDGFKPVHKRVLYAMYDGGYRPDRGYFKCARVVGDVMGNYHPHGDSAIYDTLVRLAQPWALRYPLVDGNGNFGSPGNDPPAAMRYCVTGDTLVRLADGGSVAIEELVPDAAPDSDTDIDLKVLDRRGNPVRASKFFHSGTHPVLQLRTAGGFSVTGSTNHPVLCLVPVAGVPMLLWKTLAEVSAGDRVVLYRGTANVGDTPTSSTLDAAFLAGAWVSEGFEGNGRLGFNNIDESFFSEVLRCFDAVVGGRRYVSRRTIASGSMLHELDIHNVEAWHASVMTDVDPVGSEDKRIPSFVLRGGPSVKRAFLQALFTGDGSCSLLPRSTMQISYSTRSRLLAEDVQQLLLEFGVVSSISTNARVEHKVVISNRRDSRLFATRVGFWGAKQQKLIALLDRVPTSSTALSGDHVPYLAEFVRSEVTGRRSDRDWLVRHNIDRIERWERDGDEILRRIADRDIVSTIEPLVDGSLFFAEVASVLPLGEQPVYSLRVDTDDHTFLTNGFISHNTECRLAPLAMEMLRDIDKDTVDFAPNYDGRSQEPLVLPSRFPNLLVNGSAGIAVGMATNIPPHNLREVGDAVQWFLDSPEATDEQLLEACLERVKGPDFPTGALIVGRSGIEEAYRTGRGSVRMRAVIDVEEDSKGHQMLVVTQLPYQVNPDNLAEKIAELANDGRVGGISNVQDESSGRTGQRLVIYLKRDAVAKVVLNNLYKHSQLQDTFGVNMVALVDGVPRTLRIDQMVRYWVAHQVEVVVRRTRFLLRKAEERAHILRGYLKALDALDAVIALIRNSDSADDARVGLMGLLDIDDEQARAILDMQLRRLAALERQRIQQEYDELMAEIAEYTAILESPARQREVISTELAEIVARYGDERRTKLVPYEGDMSLEDLIAEEDVVVTITLGGYAKRTKTDLYRSQRRGGRGVQGAQLRGDDIVEHFFVTTTHHWILFFTNKGRVYRAKAHELPEANRNARGQHVANILAFQPDEHIAQVIDMRDYDAAPYLVLATRRGLVKKSPLTDFDSNRSGGLIAINLHEEDELIGAALISAEEDLLLVSKNAQSIRFHADDATLRPMGRATSGVIGMRFGDSDELLAMEVVRPDHDVLIVTDGGYAKRTSVDEYPVQGRGGKGVLTAKIVSSRGGLVGALIVAPDDEVFAITSSGGVIRTRVHEVRRAQRQTMGVRLINLDTGQTVVGVARNGESQDDGMDDGSTTEADPETPGSS